MFEDKIIYCSPMSFTTLNHPENSIKKIVIDDFNKNNIWFECEGKRYKYNQDNEFNTEIDDKNGFKFKFLDSEYYFEKKNCF